MTNKEQDTILYYPSIEIKDGDWLRKAILYWDKVASIVPEGNYSDDSWRDMRYLLNVDLYEPIYPSELEVDSELVDEFCRQVKEQLRLHNDKRNWNHKSEVHVNKTMYVPKPVNMAKTSKTICDFLLDEGIARRKDEEWLYMTEYDSMVYMALLAKFLAKKHDGMHIGTDNRTFFRKPFIMNGAKMGHEEKQIYMNVQINDILPCPIREEVSLDDIIEFKKRHEKELERFRRRINDYRRQLNNCSNCDHIDEVVHDLRCSLEEDMNEIEEYMHSRWTRVVRGAVTALVPLGIQYAEMKGFLSKDASLVVSTVAEICLSFRYVEKGSVVNDRNAFLFSGIQESIVAAGRGR